MVAGRAVLERRIVHVRNVAADTALSQVVLDLGGTAIVAIPLLRDGEPIGAVALNGRQPGGFSESQIALLQTFAEQAVIAITGAETYRALQTRTSDLQGSLEYQTATSDVLKVISRSTFDLQPVLDTLVETAARLCEADQATIVRREGDLWQTAANIGFPPEYLAYYRSRGGSRYGPSVPSVAARAVREKEPVHISQHHCSGNWRSIPCNTHRQWPLLLAPVAVLLDELNWLISPASRLAHWARNSAVRSASMAWSISS